MIKAQVAGSQWRVAMKGTKRPVLKPSFARLRVQHLEGMTTN
jgi:hypothetical protein